MEQLNGSQNFAFLAQHDGTLLRLATLAEKFFHDDPNTAVIKLRQFGELLAQQVAANSGLFQTRDEAQSDLLRRLKWEQVITPRAADLFHALRKAGNEAAHHLSGTHSDALQALKLARELGLWFHRTVARDPAFKAGPFIPPTPPENATAKLTADIEKLRAALESAKEAEETARAAAAEQACLRTSAEARAAKEAEDRAFYEKYAEEVDRELSQQRERLAVVQAEAEKAPRGQLQLQVESASQADAAIELDEAATRVLIDGQLAARGWIVDSEKITFAAGARPHRTQNMAIAEWPTASGPVDYALFCGLTCVGLVEAKRHGKDVPAVLQQAKRYAVGLTLHDGIDTPPGGPWGARGGDDGYKVPFLFATNSRAYLKQLETKSGIWFLDARHKLPSRALQGWYTPEGLKGLLGQDFAHATDRLKTEPMAYLQLRDYQERAIEAVEKAIEEGKQGCLLAMATGVGKTRTAIGLIYRAVKSGRFRRVLFVVDRTSLGDQTTDALKTMKLEQQKAFSDIYDIKELGDIKPDQDTRLQIDTIQGLIKRTLLSDDEERPAVDQYDMIIVDECHRGYNLDREMTDEELSFRSEMDYVSKYRRVLEYFDAVKIGLTATPALHTVEIFGKPVFTYGYRDAVIDGHLIDHEPPYRVLTRLAQEGIKFRAGEEVEVYKPDAQQLDLIKLPDEVSIEIEGFNRKVITENFNKAVCSHLAREIDPELPGKTLVFCVSRDHADMFVTQMKQALAERYGELGDDTVARITGDVDRPGQMIRRFKNEQNPKIVVTVDLLTTGIDVPAICNLVFLRRIRSRILYDQMLGRATRRCDDIGKEYFRIFDCVDLYVALEPYSAMKPVVTDPKLTFTDLVRELNEVASPEARQQIHDQLMAKLRVKVRRLTVARADEIAVLAEMAAVDLPKFIADVGPGGAGVWFREHPGVAPLLDKPSGGRPPVLVSHEEDEVTLVERGYGKASRPEDYLEGFKKFLQTHMNEIPALQVVTQRPRDLTRQQLKEVRRLLDQEGYTEAGLRTAYCEVSNRDIAASIIGYIRQQTLGEALVPYEQRIENAMHKIMAKHRWTGLQRQWLERIGMQLRAETLVDREALDSGQFREQGGFKRLDKIFDGQLEQILGDINEALWAVN